jgi:hydrogenase maturation protein HypF
MLDAHRHALSPDLAPELTPDRATCDNCLAELRDPRNRRYRHPFVSCTACGPRYSSLSAAPGVGFDRCEQCEAEYADATGRRHLALAAYCPQCGPRLRLLAPTHQTLYAEGALAEARAVLVEGGILAVRTLGGHRLMCDATNGHSVDLLRKRLHRGDEPFAVMVAGLDEAQRIAAIGPAEARLLSDPSRPIVLAARRPGALAAAVAPGQADLGVVLAGEPVHHLLLGLPGDPPGPRALVITGARVSREPVVADEQEALSRLDGIADAWLVHDFPIGAPLDDSVTRAVVGRATPVRIGRGTAPVAFDLPFDAPPSLAIGEDEEGSVCVADQRRAWVSGHLGHLGEPLTRQALGPVVDQLLRLTGVMPAVVAADDDPESLSRRWVRGHLATSAAVDVQHHHAHVAATMVEHGVPSGQQVIGVVLDGHGRGDDGASWGAEFLVADYAGYQRAAHLAYVDLPDRHGPHQPWRVALAHLRAAGVPWDPSLPSVRASEDHERGLLDDHLHDAGRRTSTSSMARLYDAVASLSGICHHTDYEDQSVSELEARARAFGLGDLSRRTRVYAFGDDGDPTPIIWSVVQDVRKGVDPGLVAARFEHAVVELVVGNVRRLHERTGLSTVTLSGGLFVHPLLAQACLERLRSERFEVLTHSRVPAGEGGLALGQVAVLAHRRGGSAVGRRPA